jgi:ATP-dependent Zn protease
LKNNVNTVFLEQPVPSLVQTIAGGTMQLVGGFLVPYLLLVVGFNFMRRSGLMGGNNPFSTGSIDKDIQEDRNLVQRANITLSSFAGSPEIFRECTEVVSYLKNETLYKAVLFEK